jgi:hypothetical protein
VIMIHPALQTTEADLEATARALHAKMLADANVRIERTMGLPLSDAAVLNLLLIGVAATSMEEVPAIVSGIVGDEVDDVAFAGIVDALRLGIEDVEETSGTVQR